VSPSPSATGAQALLRMAGHVSSVAAAPPGVQGKQSFAAGTGPYVGSSGAAAAAASALPACRLLDAHGSPLPSSVILCALEWNHTALFSPGVRLHVDPAQYQSVRIDVSVNNKGGSLRAELTPFSPKGRMEANSSSSSSATSAAAAASVRGPLVHWAPMVGNSRRIVAAAGEFEVGEAYQAQVDPAAVTSSFLSVLQFVPSFVAIPQYTSIAKLQDDDSVLPGEQSQKTATVTVLIVPSRKPAGRGSVMSTKPQSGHPKKEPDQIKYTFTVSIQQCAPLIRRVLFVSSPEVTGLDLPMASHWIEGGFIEDQALRTQIRARPARVCTSFGTVHGITVVSAGTVEHKMAYAFQQDPPYWEDPSAPEALHQLGRSFRSIEHGENEQTMRDFDEETFHRLVHNGAADPYSSLPDSDEEKDDPVSGAAAPSSMSVRSQRPAASSLPAALRFTEVQLPKNKKLDYAQTIRNRFLLANISLLPSAVTAADEGGPAVVYADTALPWGLQTNQLRSTRQVQPPQRNQHGADARRQTEILVGTLPAAGGGAAAAAAAAATTAPNEAVAMELDDASDAQRSKSRAAAASADKPSHLQLRGGAAPLSSDVGAANSSGGRVASPKLLAIAPELPEVAANVPAASTGIPSLDECSKCEAVRSCVCDDCNEFFCESCFTVIHGHSQLRGHVRRVLLPCGHGGSDCLSAATVQCKECSKAAPLLFCQVCFDNWHLTNTKRAKHAPHAIAP